MTQQLLFNKGSDKLLDEAMCLLWCHSVNFDYLTPLFKRISRDGKEVLLDYRAGEGPQYTAEVWSELRKNDQGTILEFVRHQQTKHKWKWTLQPEDE